MMKENWWSCFIGPTTTELAYGADLPMRQAVRSAFVALTGHYETKLSSGWGYNPAILDASDRVVEAGRRRREAMRSCVNNPTRANEIRWANADSDLDAALDALDAALERG